MNARQLQQWLVEHGQPIAVDAIVGPETRAAILAAFANTCAPAVSEAQISGFAKRLSCSVRQIKAIAKVESGGSAFDSKGRPKILFERHLFHRLTDGRFSPSIFSEAKGGGYDHSSWDKLIHAACRDAEAAFAAVSWGRFQVLGMHWSALGYTSPLSLAYSTVCTEAAHYELLCRYIETNKLSQHVQCLSAKASDNRAFARAYNGPAYERFAYHEKLAREMAA